MKKYLLALLALVLMGPMVNDTVMASQPEQKMMVKNVPILYQKLPQQARTFIKKYWKEANLNLIYKTDFGYQVQMDNGVTVKFNRSGRWFNIQGFDALPTGMLPSAIMSYMNQYYPEEYFLNIHKGSRGYDCTVTKGLILKFTTAGKFIKLDF